MAWTDRERREWEEHGFFLRRGFAEAGAPNAMLDDVVGVARGADGRGLHEGTLILPESNLRGRSGESRAPEGQLSKIFKLHRRAAFNRFIRSAPVLSLLREMFDGEVDCFLSQFIFKNPGAWGQPWHQDSYYFPFDRTPQVGLWLAVTDATLENGCLHVVPGSHKEPIHEHIPDRRPGANFGYVEIVDHDMSGSVTVTMQAGDLLVFHSHLMHSSRDNESDRLRAAMVYHSAARGTQDKSPSPTPVNDWMPLDDL